MEKLLVVGAALVSKEIVEYAKSQGVYTIVTDYNPPEKAPVKKIADEYWMISTADLDAMEARCRAEGVTAVLSGSNEFNVEKTMALCERLGLPYFCSPESWHYSKDKADFKALCRKVGAPVPTDYFLSDALTPEELAAVQYPVMVKPVDQCGNTGVSYCYNEKDLVEAYHYARSVSSNPKIVVERMLHGREWYSFYALAQGEIRQIALIAMEAQPGELKNIYTLSTTVTDHVEQFNAEVNPAVERVLKAVGCREGIAWVQEMLDEDGHFYVIEMGYRFPGDMPFVTFPQVFGFDAVKWVVDYARGITNRVDMLPKAQEHAYEKCGCGYSLWTNCSGKISVIEGIEEIEKIPGVSVNIIRGPGDSFEKHKKVGVIGVFGDNCDEFCRKIDQINKTIRILDENGDDVLIRYTDFERLKEYNRKGSLVG